MRIFISLILLIGIMGCQKKVAEEPFTHAQNVLNELESYYTVVTYQIFDEDEVREYRFRQWVQVPDEFKIEMLFPQNLEGNIIMSDGEQIYISHPKVQDSLKLDVEFVKQQRPLFIGDFLNTYWLSEEVIKEKKEENGEEYIVLSCVTPKTEVSHEKKSIWLDAQRMLPARMIEYDAGGKVANMILFEEFDARWEGEENFFLIP